MVLSKLLQIESKTIDGAEGPSHGKSTAMGCLHLAVTKTPNR
jgi:hypothetical protein